jgi:tetratricopeptide (TPR) repeat protein
MNVVRASSFAAVALLLLCKSASADMIQLKDGRFVDGVPMKLDGANLVLGFKNGDVKVPLSMVETYFIEGQAPPEPTTEDAKAKAAQGLVSWKGKWVKPADRDKAMKQEIESKRKEVEEAKAHSEWRNRYKFASKCFLFESTMPPSLNEYYASLLDSYFDVFKKDWNITEFPKGFDPKLKVCFYPNREDFQKIGGVSGGVLAYYRFVTPRELNFFNDRTDRRLTETVMFHECNHYLVDLFGYPLRYPHFIGEAMAEYYGASTFDPRTKTVKFGQIQEGRLAEVKSDIDSGRWYSITDYMNAEKDNYEDYYWGWSFIHFMMSTPAYQKKFKTFFIDLARAKDVQRKATGGEFRDVTTAECIRVFKDRMGIKDLNALEKEWHEYVKKLDAPTVRGYEESGKRSFHEGRPIRAARLLKTAVDMGSKDVETLSCYASCLRNKDQYDEAIAIIDKALEIDPLDARLWAERGFALEGKGEKDAGKKFVELAKEIDPNDDYVDFLGAIAHLGNDK